MELKPGPVPQRPQNSFRRLKPPKIMLSSILGIETRDKVKILNILEKTKTKRISGIIKKLTFSYAGHVVRDLQFKLNWRLTFWMPTNGSIGRRKIWRPLNRVGRGS